MTDVANDKASALDQWDRYVYMRDSGHAQFIEKADKCMRFFQGLQWEKSDLDKLQLQKRPALTINKIISTLSVIMGEQIYNRMEVSFAGMNGAPPTMADILNKLWVHDANENQLTWLRSDMFADGSITSRGFYDVRVSFEDNLRGDVSIAKLNPKNVLIDPDAEDYDPDKWEDVIISKWFSPNMIEVLYDQHAARELENRVLSTYMYGHDSIERTRDRFATEDYTAMYMDDKMRKQRRFIRVLDRQYREPKRVEFFVDPVTGDMREVPATWDRERIVTVLQRYALQTHEKVVDKVMWRVTADDLVLHDEPSPLKHFTVVPYFPYFLHGTTIGLVENLLGSQELLNKASSQELHVINTTANSGYKVKEGALKNMSIGELENRGAETGIVLELDDVKNLEKLLPNQIPSGLERITFKAEEHIKTISNVSDYMSGNAREDVAARAVEANKQSGSTSMAKPMDNLERTDWLLARAVLDIWQQYYTEPRIIHTTHEMSGKDPEIIQLNQQVGSEIVNDLTVGEYSIKVISAPYRALLEDSQFEQALKLREQGVDIEDSVLIENSRLARKTELIKGLTDRANSSEAQAAADRKTRAEEASIAQVEATTLAMTTKAKKDLADADKTAGTDAAGELAIQREKMEGELQLKREAQAADIQLQREKMQGELAIKKELAQAEAEAKRAAAAMQAAAAIQTAQQGAAGATGGEEGSGAKKEPAAAAPSTNVHIHQGGPRKFKQSKAEDGSVTIEEQQD